MAGHTAVSKTNPCLRKSPFSWRSNKTKRETGQVEAKAAAVENGRQGRKVEAILQMEIRKGLSDQDST